MNLKHAILVQLGRDVLKQIVDELEFYGVDRRSVDEMRAALSRVPRASPERLLVHLGESQVKEVCEAVGVSATGRRQQLVERLLATQAGNEQSAGSTTTAADERKTAPMASERTASGNDPPAAGRGARRAALRVKPRPRIDGRHEEVEDVCFGEPLIQRTKSEGENPVYYMLGQT